MLAEVYFALFVNVLSKMGFKKESDMIRAMF